MIVMHLDPIKGDCNIKGYSEWITLDECNFEITREPKESGQHGTQDLQLGMPECAPISMAKTVDKASVYLKKMSIGGGALGKDSQCRIVWLASGLGEADKQQFDKYMEVVLTRPIIKKYSITSTNSDRAQENIELMYSKILMSYYERNPANGSTTEHGPQGWDLVTGEPCGS